MLFSRMGEASIWAWITDQDVYCVQPRARCCGEKKNKNHMVLADPSSVGTEDYQSRMVRLRPIHNVKTQDKTQDLE